MEWLFTAHSDIARLPALAMQQGWLKAGWGVVVACLGTWCVGRWTNRKDVKVVLSAVLAAGVCWPGPWGGGYWLGLAFQAPSVNTVFVCAMLWASMLTAPPDTGASSKTWPMYLYFHIVCGVVLGWALLLDTFGVWHSSLYGWGFSAAAPAFVIVMALLPWVFAKKAMPTIGVAVALAAVVFFISMRLPSGNLFDALMDPWLWVAMHLALFQQYRFFFARASS